jgi:DNA-binding NarL/FixJ family response regulator
VTGSKPIRVLWVDDHPLVCKGVAFILANQEDMELVGEANKRSGVFPTGHEDA